jgi:hypothetical protein
MAGRDVTSLENGVSWQRCRVCLWGEICGASLHTSGVAVFPSQGSFRKKSPGGAKSNFSAADSALLVVGASVCM